MRTAQKVRQQTDTVTEVQSITLVRNILRSGISSIAYLRYLFPEENFQDTSLAGLKIKSLVPANNKEIEALNRWIEEGVFDALQKHYLRALVFSVFKEYNNPSSLLESYTFKFTYPSDGNVSLDFTAQTGNEEKKLSFMSKEQIQQAWCTMIRTLITLSHALPPLPHKRHIAMRLYYYDDITPADYNPPGFAQADDAPDFEFIEESERIDVGGSVKTKFHSVQMRLDTAMPAYKEKHPEEVTISEMSEDLIKSLVFCFEKGSINSKDISNKLGLSPSDQRVEEIIQDLLSREIIIVEDGIYKVNQTEENQSLFKAAQDYLNKESTKPI
ncbi:HORMA domain containing protein [Trichomonas vaginalis G3]|uniref:HORMA domain containing protein n=2 Tax=Trichomonas vaginalis TaxID=5722 RepID=A2EE01_TRIV3|nr:Hop1-like protein [Trichomonas vaginalis G3]ABC61969.1 Hop1-like protein [Trichomonas vaginalis]AEW27257.1 Hop1 [Trichomonas vaginalis]AEW27258.1 Hop1 [Trichomonas vaginalis]AEW27259.1 Hop1 [Trichomonas vaginalis]AEW27260.1 Hop1 [Trichomonas vaginalis]|eukprot:XP_001321336.1 HORMA domain containing protein [Trichomonas vaginalis G3]